MLKPNKTNQHMKLEDCTRTELAARIVDVIQDSAFKELFDNHMTRLRTHYHLCNMVEETAQQIGYTRELIKYEDAKFLRPYLIEDANRCKEKHGNIRNFWNYYPILDKFKDFLNLGDYYDLFSQKEIFSIIRDQNFNTAYKEPQQPSPKKNSLVSASDSELLSNLDRYSLLYLLNTTIISLPKKEIFFLNCVWELIIMGVCNEKRSHKSKNEASPLQRDEGDHELMDKLNADRKTLEYLENVLQRKRECLKDYISN